MEKWVERIMDILGVNPDACKKPPELARAIPEAELREKGCGFIAIVDRKMRTTQIYLALKALIINGNGDATYKHELKWDEYGRTWQAYEIGAFADFAEGTEG